MRRIGRQDPAPEEAAFSGIVSDDLIFDTGVRLLRVQCKWGRVKDDVVAVATRTSRTTSSGYVSSTYSADEIDLIAAYCQPLRQVFCIPISEIEGQTFIHLRLRPCRNNQSIGVKW